MEGQAFIPAHGANGAHRKAKQQSTANSTTPPPIKPKKLLITILLPPTLNLTPHHHLNYRNQIGLCQEELEAPLASAVHSPCNAIPWADLWHAFITNTEEGKGMGGDGASGGGGHTNQAAAFLCEIGVVGG